MSGPPAGAPAGPLDALVTLFGRVTTPNRPDSDMTVAAALDAVRSGRWELDVSGIRVLSDPQARQAAKRERLPVLTLSGAFDQRRSAGLRAHSGMLALDFDHVGDLAGLRAELEASPHVAAVFLSVSGDGLKALVPVRVVDPDTGEVRRPRDDAEHKRTFAAARALFPSADADEACKDVARCCFVSHDPDLYVNGAAEPVEASVAPERAPRPERAQRARQTPQRGQGATEAERVRSALLAVPARPPYAEWIRVVAAVLDAVGGSEPEAEALLCEWSPEETEGEYRAKMREGLSTVTAGTLFYLAKQHGWAPPRAAPNAALPRLSGDGHAGEAPLARVSAPEGAPDRPVPLGVCLADVEPEPVRWAWPGWLALGKVHVFDGDPGMGKSTILAALAASVTAGVPWPDGRPVPTAARGGVVVLTAEDDPATTIRPRMEAAGADVRLVSVVATIPTAPTPQAPRGTGRLPVLPDDVALVVGECRRVGARLLVVDPVTAYLGEVNSHRDSDVRGALAPLAAAAEEAGVAVVLIRHLNKGAGGSALYRGGGSIAFAGLARIVWLVGRDPEDPERRALAVSKNNIAAFPETIGYELVSAGPFSVGKAVWTGGLALSADDLVRPAAAGPQTTTPAQDAAADFLLEMLASGPRMARDVYAAAEAAGIPERTLKRAKGRLKIEAVRKGSLGADGGWYWLPPADGPAGATPGAGHPPKSGRPAKGATVGMIGAAGPPDEAEADPNRPNQPDLPKGAKGCQTPDPLAPLADAAPVGPLSKTAQKRPSAGEPEWPAVGGRWDGEDPF